MMWYTPPGYSRPEYAELLKVNHLLVAGCSGSGKSVVLRGMLRELLQTSAPCQKKIILLDPKRVDFNEFKNIPHMMRYANTMETMVQALNDAIDLMESRYKDMERRGLKLYDGADVYVIIDEYADLKDVGGKDVENKVIRLCQLSRAARMHIIIATQRAVSCVNTRIRANLDNRLALHTINKKESINIIDMAGAEALPYNGQGILQTPRGYEKVTLNYVDTCETDKLINYWLSNACKR